jgi:hypothetical protein
MSNHVMGAVNCGICGAGCDAEPTPNLVRADTGETVCPECADRIAPGLTKIQQLIHEEPPIAWPLQRSGEAWNTNEQYDKNKLKAMLVRFLGQRCLMSPEQVEAVASDILRRPAEL